MTSKTKTQELMASLTKSEHIGFQDYLGSAFFDCHPDTPRLYEMLIGSKGNAFPEKTVMYQSLYPRKKYDDKHLRYILSDLNKHLIQFITMRYLQKDPLHLSILSAQALSERDCEKAYSLIHHEIISENGYRDAGWYRYQFEHAEQHLVYTGSKLNRKSTPDYSETLSHLDIFYLVKKLQLSCEVTNLANILNKKYEIALLDEMKQLALNSAYNHVPAVQIYYHILGTLTPGINEEHFNSVRELIKQHNQLFNPKEQGEMYQYLKNYCVRQVNSGSASHLRTLFEIYNEMLNNDSLMKHDYMSQWEFKNMVSISLRLNENTWCEKFIKKFISYLRPEERKNALAYNMAYFLFIKNDFRNAIRKLQEVELNDVFYQLDARVILLKSFYELDDTDSYFYQASAFRLFLLRNRHISDYQRRIYRNLIRFLTAIVRAGTSKTKLLRIKTEIEKEKNLADINWIITKVNEAMG